MGFGYNPLPQLRNSGFQPSPGTMVVSWSSNYCTTHSQANESSLSEKQNRVCASECKWVHGSGGSREGVGWGKGHRQAKGWGGQGVRGWGELPRSRVTSVSSDECSLHTVQHSTYTYRECISRPHDPSISCPSANLQLPSDLQLSSVIVDGWSAF